jgi:hypothetical protein
MAINKKLPDIKNEPNIYSRVSKKFNNVLYNDNDMSHSSNQISFLAKMYYIIIVYLSSYLQIYITIASIWLSNLCSFFKREKNIGDRVILITGSGGYLG